MMDMDMDRDMDDGLRWVMVWNPNKSRDPAIFVNRAKRVLCPSLSQACFARLWTISSAITKSLFYFHFNEAAG